MDLGGALGQVGDDQLAPAGGALQQPVQRDLRDRLAGLPGDLVQRIDHVVQIVEVDLRAGIVGGLRLQTAVLGQRLATADLAGQPAPAQRAPYQRPNPLVGASGISSHS